MSTKPGSRSRALTRRLEERQALERLARQMREPQDTEELTELDDALLAVWIELWPEGGQG
jgi:hypothetical protein